MPGVLLFVDNSNIYISGKDVSEKMDGSANRSKFRMEFAHLVELALANRKLLGAYVVGSIPPEDKAVWESLERSTGIKPELYERGINSGGEQGLDQCLQVHMLRSINDFKEPQIVVLMTGDGAGYKDGVGFHADLERMYNSGWGIEVLSWEHSCNKSLKEWANKCGVFIALDNYYNSISFVKGTRTVAPVVLANRAISSVRKSPLQIAQENAKAEEVSKIAALQRQIDELNAEKLKKQKGKDRHDRRFKMGKKN
jgi:uncharacterized small protein (DUF1192 family)